MSSSSIDPAELKALLKRMTSIANSQFPIVATVYVYMLIVITGMDRDQGIWAVTRVFPFVVVYSAVGSHLALSIPLKNAFSIQPGDSVTARLERILMVPRRIELLTIFVTATTFVLFTAAVAVRFDKSLWTIPWCVVVFSLQTALLQLTSRTQIDALLRPYAIAEFHRNPQALPQGSGIFWIRQRWYLPYAFGVFVACTIATVTSVLLRQGYDSYLSIRERLSGMTQISPMQVLEMVDQAVDKMGRDSLLPISLLGTYLLLCAAVTAWQLSKYQSDGARSVQTTVEALASGNPKLPEWVSTDEIGDLAAATAKAFGRLKAFSTSLGESAEALRRSAEQLGLSTSKQSEALTHQATALQETQVTAQEIKQTSALTAQKAENILTQTDKADQISRAGEAAIQHSLDGLQEIGQQVKEMARQIRDLDQRTRQIASITTTVKDLADQSNMLALNAAIEAVRSGEHGKGFGVVAREIRTLADQSIRATNNVRSILQDISTAIRNTASMTEKGSEKVDSSLAQVREFGNNIRDLSGIVRENASSVRQITAAVTQQNTGISQIFQAVHDLSRLMDQTMEQLRTSDEALEQVRSVTDKVALMSGETLNASSSAATAHPHGQVQ